jgi:hypothetical protein
MDCTAPVLDGYNCLNRWRVHPPSAGFPTSSQGLQIVKLDAEVDFFDGVFVLKLVQCIIFTESRLGAQLRRTPLRTFPSATRLACAAHPALSPLAGCESHDSCPTVCAASKLKIHPSHPQRAAASRAGAGAPRAPLRLVRPSPSHAAHHCLRAAGPRATP